MGKVKKFRTGKKENGARCVMNGWMYVDMGSAMKREVFDTMGVDGMRKMGVRNKDMGRCDYESNRFMRFKRNLFL